MNPAISVIIPVYNSEQYITQAIKSVLNQTYQDFEIIIVNDASTDKTVEIVQQFTDQRIKLINNQQNLGVSKARNRALQKAKGKWIALLDSDDWYAPQRLEKLLTVARQHNADMVADDLYLIRSRESIPWSTLLKENRQDSNSIQLIDAVQYIISDRPSPIKFKSRRTWSLGYTKPLIRAKFLAQHQIKYQENLDVGEDFAFYLECLLNKAQFFLLPQPYYYYRNRQASLSVRTTIEYLYQSYQVTQYFIDHREVKQNQHLKTALKSNLTSFQNRLAYRRVLEFIKLTNLLNLLKLTLGINLKNS
ncbi:MAG: glycosyltransferase family 2 protein [Pleurocapsa sp.]